MSASRYQSGGPATRVGRAVERAARWPRLMARSQPLDAEDVRRRRRVELDVVPRPLPAEATVLQLVDDLVARLVRQPESGQVDVDEPALALVGVEADDDEDGRAGVGRVGLRVAEQRVAR